MKIIAGKYKGHKLHAPRVETTRPTQSVLREALFNICQNKIEGAYFLDLFAGSGAIAFEALSRGAAKAVMIENHPNAIAAIKKNAASFQLKEEWLLIPKEIFIGLKFLKVKGLNFDIIYIDPPYQMEISKKKKVIENCLLFLKKGGDLFLEDEKTNEELAIPLTFVGKRRFGKSFLFHWIK